MSSVTAIPLETVIMRRLNFTDDMYDVMFMDHEQPVPCVEAFHSIGHSYKAIHGYIALVVCVFGTAANSLNLLILTQKDMRTPINLILSALALVDALVMIEYIPFALHMYIFTGGSRDANDPHFSYPWALFVLFHSHFTQILHTMAIQLTLTMAIWRYMAIRFTNQVQVNAFCTLRRCQFAIGASFVLPLFICIPNYLTFSILRRRSWTFNNSASLPPFLRGRQALRPDPLLNLCRLFMRGDTSCPTKIVAKEDYVVDLSDLARQNGGLLHIVHFWTFSVLVKLLPCVVLTFFMVYLLHTLYAAKQRHKVLQPSSAIPPTPVKLTPSRSSEPIPRSADPMSKNHLLPNGSLTPPTRLMVFEDRSKSVMTLAVEESSPHGEKRWFSNWRKTSSPVDEHAKRAARRSERTSRMLVAVLCLFVLTELPQGVMAFLSGFYGAEFFRRCYNAFAEIWDLLALVNSAVNFLLYCFMSRQFRVHFRNFFPWKCFRTEKPQTVGNGNHKHTVHTTLL